MKRLEIHTRLKNKKTAGLLILVILLLSFAVTLAYYNDVLTLQVWEYDPDMDGILIFEQDVSTEDENALREAFQAENDALWSGIR